MYVCMYVCIYYAHLASVRFDHSVSWITYDHIHIYIHIYILYNVVNIYEI